jgi:transcription elongation GreA/GreB family factor
MKIADNTTGIMVITPGSPLGRALLGRMTGDEVQVQAGGAAAAAVFTIVAVR